MVIDLSELFLSDTRYELFEIIFLGRNWFLWPCPRGPRSWNIYLLRSEDLLHHSCCTISTGRSIVLQRITEFNVRLSSLSQTDHVKSEKRNSLCDQAPVHHSTALDTSFRSISVHALGLHPRWRTLFLHAAQRNLWFEILLVLHMWNHSCLRISSFAPDCLP